MADLHCRIGHLTRQSRLFRFDIEQSAVDVTGNQ